MRVQLQGQQLRLRIDEAELARLQAGETVENLTRLPGGAVCRQQLVLAAQPRLAGSAADWRFELPQAELAAHVARLPCRDGLVFPLAVENGIAIEIHFDVDVRDSVRSRGAVRRGGSRMPAA